MPETPRAADGGKPTPPPHPTSLAVWGVPSPVVVNRHFTVTVGVKCAEACPLAGQRITVHDETGAEVGKGRLAESPAPGTHALYAAEVTLTAPAGEGVHSWSAAFVPESRPATPAESGEPGPAYGYPTAAPPASSAAPRPGAARPRASAAARAVSSTTSAPGSSARPAPAATKSKTAVAADVMATPHAASHATFGFRAAGPPQHRVTVTVRDRDTGAPLRDVEVCVGAYRTSTGESCRATVEVPGGRYELHMRKAGYAVHTGSVAVDRDVTLEIAAVAASDTDLDDDQLWM